jgi:endoglycosylceramidase
MIRRSLALACLCLAPFAASVARADPTLPLGHAGRWLTDAQGRVVIQHGTNMVYKLQPYYPGAVGFGDDDAVFLRSIGFNTVRVGVIWKALEPRPGSYDDRYLAQIAATVSTLARHGIVSLLDFHQDLYNERFQGEGAPDWAVLDDGLPAIPQLGFPLNYFLMPALQQAFNHFWANSPGPGGIGLQDRFAAAWRHVARRFAGNRAVLGYEILNEPFPGTGFALCALPGGCAAFDAELTSFNRAIDAAIRSTDRRTLVFYEPNVAFDFGFMTNVGGLRDPRAVFSFHNYCLTNEGSGCSSHAQPFAYAAAHVAQTHEASMLTEFGATNSASDLGTMLTLADTYRVSWQEWAYTGYDPTTAGGDSQAIVINPRRPPTGSNLALSTIRALVEPYPQVVAGTPLSWHFDRHASTFTLRYVVARAGGSGVFRPESVTEIAAPSLIYGRGYAATVSGGAILSARGATVLRIASCRGASTITVTVTPAGRSRGSCRIQRRGRRPARRRSSSKRHRPGRSRH